MSARREPRAAVPPPQACRAAWPESLAGRAGRKPPSNWSRLLSSPRAAPARPFANRPRTRRGFSRRRERRRSLRAGRGGELSQATPALAAESGASRGIAGAGSGAAARDAGQVSAGCAGTSFILTSLTFLTSFGEGRGSIRLHAGRALTARRRRCGGRREPESGPAGPPAVARAAGSAPEPLAASFRAEG